MRVNFKSSIIIHSQAYRIIDKFGGARKLARSLKAIGRPRNPSVIYKWMYPRNKGGTDGLIPTSAWPDLLLAAKAEGILLEPEDKDPSRTNPKFPLDIFT
jgi:hypothetical protein